jgi:hypothetical protein
MAQVKIDPRLLDQLEASSAGGEPVGAVFTLKTGATRGFIPPAEVEAIVGEILGRVQKETGTAPVQCNVFKNMGAFVVSAGAPFVRKLLDQGEIESATANKQADELLIRPVSARPVAAPEPGARKRPR